MRSGRACASSSRPKMNFLSLEGLIPDCRLFAGKALGEAREEAAPTAELRAESGRGSPGLGAGSGPGVSNTAVTGRGPSRLRDGGEGGPALRAHLQFLTLLAGPPPLAGERAENFCWDKRSLCIFFFFFFP